MFYFETFTDFMAMCYVNAKGVEMCHGAFVWSAYGIALALIVYMTVAPIQRGKAIRKSILRQVRRDAATAKHQQQQEETS